MIGMVENRLLFVAYAMRGERMGRAEPDQPARAYLTVIAHDPEGVRRARETRPG